MPNNIWNFLRGYVRISIKGFHAERLLNQAAASGQWLFNVRREGFAIEAYALRAALPQLRDLAEGGRCTLDILERRGLPYIVYGNRHRKGLAVGLILAIGAVIAMSSFIWRLDIEGLDGSGLAIEELEAFLTDNGLGIGARRGGVELRGLEDSILAHFPQLAWAAINITGTAAHVALSPAIAPIEALATEPADIIAAKDGIIMSIVTAQGTPLVRAGDVVLAGDVLVSSAIEIAAEGHEPMTEFVHAQAYVYARIYYRLSLHVPFLYYERSFTGAYRRVHTLNIGGLSIPLSRRNNYAQYTSEEERRQLSFGANYPMPITMDIREYREFNSVVMQRSVDQAIAFGQAAIDNYILESFGLDVELLSQDLTFIEQHDGINIDIFIVTIERIDQSLQHTLHQEE